MKFNRKNLLACLEKVYPAVGTNVLVPELQCFYIYDDIIQGHNGSQLIRTFFSENTEMRCLIPAKSFLFFLRSLKQEIIELICKGDDQLIVKAKKVKGKFAISKLEKLESLKDRLDRGVSTERDDIDSFIDALNFCKFGVSADETSGPLCGVRVRGDKVYSTDRIRILRALLKKNLPLKDVDCSLPVKFVDILQKCKKEIRKLSYVKDTYFTVILEDNTIISTPVLLGDYLDLEKFIPAPEGFKSLDFVDDFSEVLDRHINFQSTVDTIDKSIEVSVSATGCVFTTVTDTDRLEEEVEISLELLSDEVFSFSVNPVFFKDIARKCFSLKYFTEDNLILFEETDYYFLVKGRSTSAKGK